MSTTIMDDLKVLGEQLERLQIEYRLLRAASEEQRELIGTLREELKYRTFTIKVLESWASWFNTWSIMLDGTAFDEAYDTYKLTKELLDDLDIAIGRRNGTSI